MPIHITVDTGGFGTFGWDSVAAISTIVLAFFTWRLAGSTRRLAQETRDDVRSTFRPVLIDARGGILRITYPTEPSLGTCTLDVKNVGPGPALNVQMTIEANVDNWAAKTSLGTISTRGPGVEWEGTQTATFRDFPRVSSGLEFTANCTYEDLAKTNYCSVFRYETKDATRRLNDGTVEVPLVDTLIPQLSNPGVHPVRHPFRWIRGKLCGSTS